jgi:hypothetical protein
MGLESREKLRDSCLIVLRGDYGTVQAAISVDIRRVT